MGEFEWVIWKGGHGQNKRHVRINNAGRNDREMTADLSLCKNYYVATRLIVEFPRFSRRGWFFPRRVDFFKDREGVGYVEKFNQIDMFLGHPGGFYMFGTCFPHVSHVWSMFFTCFTCLKHVFHMFRMFSRKSDQISRAILSARALLEGLLKGQDY